MNYNHLFTPIKVGDVTIRNRIGIAAMGLFSANTDGSPSLYTSAFYERRAKGGAGLIIVGASMVSKKAANGITAMYWEDKGVIPHHTDIVERVHRYGSVAAIAIGVGSGRNTVPAMLDGREPVSASAVPYKWDTSVLCRPLTVGEIKEYVAGYERAAANAKAAGYDIIEVHAHCGYLIDQFLSPLWNKREDEYGGSEENRARFAVEIMEAIRKGAGKDMPIIYRIAPDHRIEGSRTLDNCGPLFQLLEQAGASAFDVDAGSYEQLDYIFPPAYLGDACLSYVCPTVKKYTNLPVLNAGNHTPETAANLIASGNADIALIGRGLIADPDLPKKLMYGDREEVRPCIRCNEECVRRTFERTTKISCAVNPSVNEEMFFQIQKVPEPKKVMVIGGGPAGMEAARVAAMEGNQVTLFERNHKLGGNAAVAATPQFKSQIKSLLAWYESQLDKYQVTLRMNTEVDMNNKLLKESDLVVVAIGADEFVPPIPGIEGENVISVIEAHNQKELIKGERIVICGGGLSGCDSALELSREYGKKVTIIEMRPELCEGIFVVNKLSLMNALKEEGVQLRCSCKVSRIDSENVYIVNEEGEEEQISSDTVITAFGLRKNDELAEEIRNKYPIKTWVIGDCSRVGNIGKAVRAGYYAAMSLI